MNDQAIQKARELCIRFEAIRLRPYLCAAGVPTIGVGSTTYYGKRKVTLADPPITREEAFKMLDWELERCRESIIQLSPVLTLHPMKMAAIMDFIYNLGSTRYKASTLRRRINDQRWQDAKYELTKWVWAAGKKLSGLIVRREVEGKLFD